VMLQFGASLLTMLAKARIINYERNCSFIVLATVSTIVNYDCHLFIVQATDDKKNNLPNFLNNSQKSYQVKKAKISTTKLNLKTQNIYIKPLLKP
jgi:hypothetical protein